MATELSARVALQEGLHFVGTVPSGMQVHMDSPIAGADPAGPTPMEMVLMSLAGCSGMDVMSVLRKKRQAVAGMEILVHGKRRAEYPTVFTEITIEYVIRGEAIDPRAVERAIELSRERYCPVWAMLGQGAQITPSYRLSEAPAGAPDSATTQER